MLFLIFGTIQFPRSRRKRLVKMYAKIETEARRFRGHPNMVRSRSGAPAGDDGSGGGTSGQLSDPGGNQATFLAETDEFIDRLIADIDKARNHVHLLFYIFWDDETGVRVIDALARAVKRGVRCRVLGR